MLPTRTLFSRAMTAVCLALLALAAVPVSSSAAPRGGDVSFTSDGQTLHGTIVAPPGSPVRRPGLVIVAGAGSTSRWDYLAEAQAFARAGIVVLIYDKRAGYSRATTSFRDLADDALAGLELLRARPGVAPDRVGLWGHSQGGWVVPLAASTSSHVAFVVAVGASALPAGRTQLWSNRTYLVHAGVAPELIDPIGLRLSRAMIAAGLFGDTTHDPVATLEHVHQPLLGIFGDRDRSTAPGESLTVFRQALDRGGNRHYTLRVVHGASHTMRASADGFASRASSAPFAPGYIELTTSWIDALAAGAPAVSADPAPEQAFHSDPVAPPAWFESPWLQAAATLLLLLAFLTYPVGAVIRRLRGRRGPLPAFWPAHALAAFGLATVAGTVVYLFSIVSTGATEVQGSVLGRPLPWLPLQLGACAVVLSLAAVALRRRRVWAPGPESDRMRLAVLAAAGIVFIPWALSWGLFTV